MPCWDSGTTESTPCPKAESIMPPPKNIWGWLLQWGRYSISSWQECDNRPDSIIDSKSGKIMSIRYLMLAGKRKVNGLVKETKSGSKTDPLLEASTGFEPVNEGFADPCLTTWPRRRKIRKRIADRNLLQSAILHIWAGDGIRTHDLLLGKETFYHWTTPACTTCLLGRECRDPGSNWGHRDFQSRALPTELSRRSHIQLLSARDFTRSYMDCQEMEKRIKAIRRQHKYLLDFSPSIRYNFRLLSKGTV